MNYISTRNKQATVSASQAIVQGISKDGGLFVPSFFPKMEQKDFLDLLGKSYKEIAAKVLSKYLTEFKEEELQEFANLAYSRFSKEQIPVKYLDKNRNIIEIWYGPTAAFKDAALTILPYLMVSSKEKTKENNSTLVLVATSGDTGKAALEGFKDVDGTDVMVFYPSDGVSPMQKLQMMTQEGKNVYVCAIKGNFDDAQTAVKKIFQDKNIIEKLAKDGYKLSSANSINWGRLVPQIVYYISSYLDLVQNKKIKLGDKVNICVPTGNFGNILASYYAFRMGLPVNKFICASNSNNVLTDFFNTGVYDANREFIKTMSPSMDILISSNLERLVFEASERNDEYVADLMKQLKENNKYKLDEKYFKNISNFYGNFATEEETQKTIKKYFDKYNYLIDTHTAVACFVYDKYLEQTKDETPTLIASTANPYKFPVDVLEALTNQKEEDAQKAVNKIKEITNLNIPNTLRDLDKKEIRFNKVIEKQEIDNQVLNFINK